MTDEILLTAHLRDRGVDHNDLARQLSGGTLSRVRRGAYAVPSSEKLSAEAAHRLLVRATAPQLGEGAVISHTSAAVLHRLPIWKGDLGRVHVTRNRSNGARRRTLVEVHGAPLSVEDVTAIDGVPVTSLTRTVLDVSRTLAFDRAVAVGDRALARGLNRAELLVALDRMAHWRGIRQARRAVEFFDGRSESPGESVSRVRIVDDGLPLPDLQIDIFGPLGNFLGRPDFLWKEQRTLGEFDGKAKYGRLVANGRTAQDVLFDEKCREDALRDLGWQIVRWIWADLYEPGVIRDRLLRAFARASRV